jgi:hypothetical protein
VVGPEEDADRVLEGRVLREPGGIDVAVRADDGQPLDAREQSPGDGALAGLGRQEAVRVEVERRGQGRGLRMGEIGLTS